MRFLLSLNFFRSYYRFGWLMVTNTYCNSPRSTKEDPVNDGFTLEQRELNFYFTEPSEYQCLRVYNTTYRGLLST
jgi:hypothetical protein